MSDPTPEIVIPENLLPADGRFGCGPSRIRPEQIEHLAGAGAGYLGTSHRQAPVRSVVRRIREGIAEIFALPGDYEVVLGNGGHDGVLGGRGVLPSRSPGAALLVRRVLLEVRQGHRRRAVAGGPDGDRVAAGQPPGAAGRAGHRLLRADAQRDVDRRGDADPPGRRSRPGALVLVDATSGAGGLPVSAAEFDAYYFAPQKCFGSDGGLWIALLSPTALARTAQIAASNRYIPEFLSLQVAIDNSRLQQTYNTPAIAHLLLLADQVEWILDQGGLEWAIKRTAESSSILYSWAEQVPFATPFVADPRQRSQVVGTIDFADTIDAAALSATLRRNGIVDTDSYRKLGRNQLRIGMFPAVEPADVQALTACIDYVIERS